MHNYQNCHENVWILSGTADGPILVDKLLKLNYVVFVSVISYRASQAYKANKKLHIFTGILSNEEEIKSFIKKNQIDRIIDATHPFALEISDKLFRASLQISLPLIRFERNFDKRVDMNFKVISNLKGINDVDLHKSNLLLAIGSRYLDSTARFYKDLGANVFARIISTPESISRGFASCVDNSNLAILNPSKIIDNNLEFYICKYWSIDYILCRDSGGYPQMIWEQISFLSKIQLFLSKRPETNENVFKCSSYESLIEVLKLT